MPSTLPYLDYGVQDLEDSVVAGQLVVIPLHNKREYGLVRALTETSGVDESKLKNVASIVLREPLIPQSLIEFYIELAEFYRAPVGFVVKSALLPLKKNKLPKIEKKLIVFDSNKLISPQKPILVSYQDIESRNKIISKLATQRGQTLVLVPEINDIAPLCDMLSAVLAQKPIAINADIGDKDYFDLWLKVRSDENAIVVGTRKALFLPWINLQNIIIDDEGSADYKSWDMSPRFHARDAALMLAKYTGAKLYLMSLSPSVDSYFFAKENVYDKAGNVEKLSTPSAIFIDAKQERINTRAGYISQDIIESIENAIGDSFILVNRRGTSNAVICRDCGHIFNCPSCRRPMTYFEVGQKLNCVFCRETKTLNSVCPACGGPSYRMIAPGVEGIASELKKVLPKKRIVSVDKSEPSSLKNMKFPGSKIIVGTKFAWAKLNWPLISVFVFADADSALAMPEFKATEFLWQSIRQAQFKLPDSAKLFIQTSKQEHHIFQGLYNPTIFYETELAERRAFNYPPHQYLVRLIYAGSPALADREAARMFKYLQFLTQTLGDVKINGPFPSSPPILRGRTNRIIIIKLSYKNYKQRLREIAKSIPEEWKIDPNPNSLLSIS